MHRMTHQGLAFLIEKCRSEDDVDSQISMLNRINNSLPESERLRLPSLITDDYVFRALEAIEERILPSRTVIV
jgi:hypothetical protein